MRNAISTLLCVGVLSFNVSYSNADDALDTLNVFRSAGWSYLVTEANDWKPIINAIGPAGRPTFHTVEYAFCAEGTHPTEHGHFRLRRTNDAGNTISVFAGECKHIQFFSNVTVEAKAEGSNIRLFWRWVGITRR